MDEQQVEQMDTPETQQVVPEKPKTHWITIKKRVGALHFHPKNPRNITEEKVESMKASLDEFGYYSPIVANLNDVLIAGHARVVALLDQGLEDEEIEVRVPNRLLSEEEHEKLMLLDNKMGEGWWDWDRLLNSFDDQLLFDVGFSEEDLAGHFDADDKEIKEDEAPEVDSTITISNPGDVYQLGRHRLMCGDSTKIEDVEKLMNGQKADMVFTDPPYGIDLDTDYSGMPFRWNNKEMYQGKYDKVEGDNKPFDASYIIPMAKEVFLFGADYYANTLPDSGTKGTWYCWDKREDDDGDSFDKMLGSPFELCWGKKKRGKKFIRMRWASFLHSDATQGEQSKGRVHPTQKPIALCGWFIEKASEKDSNVLDLFGGSGSTLIACEQLNRTCYMMEIDPKYCDVIRKRYAKFIGKEDNWQEITKPLVSVEL